MRMMLAGVLLALVGCGGSKEVPPSWCMTSLSQEGVVETTCFPSLEDCAFGAQMERTNNKLERHPLLLSNCTKAEINHLAGYSTTENLNTLR